ncbi:hypothetical protein, partial [uncultured Enorma sp.]|uniref:hypothetical protein n=1 Tax=uncultured Enorma sp. TaxID=1714346 RepID=UPI002803DF70
MLNPAKTGETCIRRFNWMGHPSSSLPARIEVGSMLALMHEYAEKKEKPGCHSAIRESSLGSPYQIRTGDLRLERAAS